VPDLACRMRSCPSGTPAPRSAAARPERDRPISDGVSAGEEAAPRQRQESLDIGRVPITQALVSRMAQIGSGGRMQPSPRVGEDLGEGCLT
jgi:hypothetical protein